MINNACFYIIFATVGLYGTWEKPLFQATQAATLCVLVKLLTYFIFPGWRQKFYRAEQYQRCQRKRNPCITSAHNKRPKGRRKYNKAGWGTKSHAAKIRVSSKVATHWKSYTALFVIFYYSLFFIWLFNFSGVKQNLSALVSMFCFSWTSLCWVCCWYVSVSKEMVIQWSWWLWKSGNFMTKVSQGIFQRLHFLIAYHG